MFNVQSHTVYYLLVITFCPRLAVWSVYFSVFSLWVLALTLPLLCQFSMEEIQSYRPLHRHVLWNLPKSALRTWSARVDPGAYCNDCPAISRFKQPGLMSHFLVPSILGIR